MLELVVPHVVVVKLNQDVVQDWSDEMEKEIVALVNRHNFLVFEDRKSGDVGITAGELG